MKLQQSTLILMLLASLAGGFVYVYEIQGAPEREAAKAKQQQIFSFKEQDVQSLTVKTPKEMLAFERISQEKPQTPGEPRWLVKVLNSAPAAPPATCKAPAAGQTSATCQAPPPPPPSASAKPPEKPAASPKPAATASPSGSAKPAEKQAKGSETLGVPASEASVAFLLNLLATGKSDRTLVMTDPAKQRKEYGLDEPVAAVEVKLNNQQSHRLILGKPDFNGTFLYAQADPPADQSEALEVLLVSPDFQNAVNRPLSEWKSSQKNPKPSESTSKDKDSKTAPKGTGGSADKSAPKAPK